MINGSLLIEILGSQIAQTARVRLATAPYFIGWQDEEMRRIEKQRPIVAALAETSSLTAALSAVGDLHMTGLRGAPFGGWEKMTRSRKWWNDVLDATLEEGELKERIRCNWRP